MRTEVNCKLDVMLNQWSQYGRETPKKASALKWGDMLFLAKVSALAVENHLPLKISKNILWYVEIVKSTMRAAGRYIDECKKPIILPVEW